MWYRLLLIGLTATALLSHTVRADEGNVPRANFLMQFSNHSFLDANNVLLSSCCSRGMYASALYQECTYDSSAPENSGLTIEESLKCNRVFTDCCRAYRDTRACASGVALALNGSFCPYVAWSVAGARERVQRACCESCLEGVRDREIGASVLGETPGSDDQVW